jgi:hypothetical protein
MHAAILGRISLLKMEVCDIFDVSTARNLAVFRGLRDTPVKGFGCRPLTVMDDAAADDGPDLLGREPINLPGGRLARSAMPRKMG